VLVKSSNGHASLFHHIGHTNTVERSSRNLLAATFRIWRECEFCFLLAYHLVYDPKGYAGILPPASSSSVERIQEAAYGYTPEYWMLDDYTAGTSFVQ